MSSGSDLQSALETIQLDNYISLLVVTAMVYDYVLNFTKEIDYVWCRPWTWVSTMYVLVRYIGLYWGVINGLAGSTFVPGPVTVSVSTSVYSPRSVWNEIWTSKGSVIFLVCSWAFPVFLGAADLVMIVRVYTVWSRSRTILGILLFIYVPQIISAFVFTGIYNNPDTYFSVSIAQVLDFAYCNYLNSTTISTDLYFTLPRFVLSVVLFALAMTKTLKQSVSLYRAMKQWEPNQFMVLFARDGIFYFSMNVVFNIATVLQYGPYFNDITLIFLNVLSFIALCPLVPRFILSLRELYDRDLGGRWRGIDTAFGTSSHPISTRDAVVSAIAFAGIDPEEGLAVEGVADDLEVAQLKVVGSGARQA